MLDANKLHCEVSVSFIMQGIIYSHLGVLRWEMQMITPASISWVEFLVMPRHQPQRLNGFVSQTMTVGGSLAIFFFLNGCTQEGPGVGNIGQEMFKTQVFIIGQVHRQWVLASVFSGLTVTE